MKLLKRIQICATFALLGLTSCNNDVDALFEAASLSMATSAQSDAILMQGFRGCVAATALDTSRIKIDFEYPSNATRMSIYRDGTQIASFGASAGITSFVDSNLNQGQTYHYSCEAMINGVMRQGENLITKATLLFDPPTFAGLGSVKAKDAHSVTLNWNSATGVAVDHYEIFAKVGSTLSMSDTTPVQRLPLGSIETTVTGLGDELPYIFGVRACSTETICDGNSVTKKVTLADDGAPLTTGLDSIEIANSQVVLNVPWKHSDGAVRKRHVYVSTSSEISSFSLLKTVDVLPISSDLSNPPTSIPLSGLPENTNFYFLVRDEDPNGGVTTNTKVLAKNTGDLTPPNFPAGIASLANGTPADTTLAATWTAIASQPGDANGASEYLVYLSPDTKNPCTEGVLQTPTVSALAYSAGDTVTYSIAGLKERTAYRVCVKARDQAKNTSNTTVWKEKTTQDITAPAFDGIQTFDAKTLAIGWNAVNPALDLLNYQVKVWITPSGSSIETGPTALTRTPGDAPTGFTLKKTDIAFNQGDKLRVQVDACDDAAPTFGTQNCTATTRSLAVTIPDSTSPPGFLGVRPASDLSWGSPAGQGQVLVKWFAPVDWSDYLGFNIYHVNTDKSLQALKMGCECANRDCVAHPLTECLVTGLDAYRTYRFYVTAYDAAGNETKPEELDPATAQTVFRTQDTTPPVFLASASVSTVPSTGPGTGGLKVQWSAALGDNQYDAGSQITYLVYRKKGSNFTTPGLPELDVAGLLLTPQPGSTASSYDDLVANPNGVTEGDTFYYVVCARDATGNTACDGSNTLSRTVNDMTPPQLGTITSSKTNLSVKTWNLNWSIFDSVSASSKILVTVRRNTGTSATAPAKTDAVYRSSQGLTTLPGETAPDGQEGYVNYRITIADEAGNEATDTLSLPFDNKGPDKATGLNWNSGATGSASLTINAKWTRAAATLGILSDQTVNIYDVQDVGGESCTSVPVASVGVGSTVETYGFAGVDLHAYRFKLDSVDNIGNHTLSDCSAKITISAAPTAAQSRLEISSSTVPANASNTATITVTLKNLFSAPVAGKTVSVASDRGIQDTLSPPSAITNASGQAVFTVKSAYVGSPVFTATDTTDGITVTEQGSITFTVAPSQGNSTVAASTASILADNTTTSTITVTLKDSLGNRISGRTVSLVSSRPTKDTIQVLSGGVTDVNGVAQFKVRSAYEGTATYTATVVEDSISLSNTASVTYTIGPPTKVVFSVAPSNAAATDTLSPSVKIAVMDDYGHVSPAAGGTITVALQGNPVGVTLSGTKSLSLSGGEATFNDLSVDIAGTYNLTATASFGYTSATSAPFTISVGPPTRLVFKNNPQGTFAAGATIQSTTGSSILVALLDNGGNIVTNVPTTVTISLTTPNGATLGGTTSRVTGADGAAPGTAYFDDLYVRKSNTGYTLTASAAPYTSATSGTFDITPLTPNRIGFSQLRNPAVNRCSLNFAISVYDMYNNLTTTSGARVIDLSKASGAGTLRFYASTDSTCATPLNPTQVTIPDGGSSVSFKIKHDTLETIQITASTSGLTPVTASSVMKTPLAFTYTGANQTWQVPNDPNITSIFVKAWGGGGGGCPGGCRGGGGGFIQGEIPVTPGDTLTFIVAGGGGASGFWYAGGGGRSAVRKGTTELLTAGGGGGSTQISTTVYGGPGGGYTGGTSSSGNTGGTQTAAGTTTVGGSYTNPGSQFQGGYYEEPGGTLFTAGGFGGGGWVRLNSGACGGGGGWYGGGAYCLTGGSGSGGSSHADASVIDPYTVAGSQNNAGNKTDEDYQAGIGAGGIATAGGNGLIVINY